MKLLSIAAFLFALGFGISAADAPIEPFNGKDLTGWTLKPHAKNTSQWKVGKATLDATENKKLMVADGGNELVNASGAGVDIYSEATHGDAVIEVELMVPKGSNSGVYVMGRYEVQVLDSFGKEKLSNGDIGALYGATPPKSNASKAPGEWQKFTIDFRAPKFDAEGKKTANAVFVKIDLNGTVIQDNVEMKGPTPGGVSSKEAAKGPIMFQGDHGPVSFRNIKITPQ